MLKIPKDGCKELAAAIMDVTELYEVPLLNEKGLAWANLAGVMAKVYIFDGKTVQAGPVAVPRENRGTVAMPDFMTGSR